MQLLARRIERQFQRNCQQHALANELKVKCQRIKECFPGPSLPLPTVEVVAAWNDLPNDRVDILPMSMKTALVSLRAPPPTPMGLFAFDTEDVTSNQPSPNGGSNDGCLLVNGTESPMLDVVVLHDLERSTTSDDDSMSRYSYSDRPLDRRINEMDSSQSTDSNDPLSNQERLLSSGRATTRPVGFHNMVDQWLLDYRTRGTEPFIESLVAFGAVSPGTAALASRIARVVMRKVARISYTEGKSLEIAFRSTALATFKKYWTSDIQNDTWTEGSSTTHGIDIAGLMGSLFDAGIFNAKDTHLCLSLLLEGEKCFDRLCAMHVLLAQANDKLCKSRNLSALMQFKHEIMSRDDETGEYLWATAPRSNTVIADILAIIERWLVSQALRRDRSRMSPGDRIIRRRGAVGPRLRNAGPMEPLIVGI